MDKPELLAPAGSFEKVKIAFMYGADAVYLGTSKLSLRSRVEIEDNDLSKITKYAHDLGKRVYVALNIYARDYMYDEVAEQARLLKELNVDGIIVSDGGVLDVVKKEVPDIDVHISTQANTVSYHAANFWHRNGAKRIIMARELDKEEIREMMKNKAPDLELEMFIHGALCYAYSGRCHLSDFLANRYANLGDCAQSCRWEYNLYLEEKNNLGNLMPIEQDENGTYIISSKDLCLIKEIPEIIELGVKSLKIEGRLKTEYYMATVINAYRQAIDDYFENPKEYDYKKYLKEIEKTKTRGLSTFYFNDKNNKDIQEYEGKQYNSDYEFGGKVVEYDEKKSLVEIKNKLMVNDILEVIIPGKLEPFEFTISELWDADTDEPISHVNPGKDGQKVKMTIPYKCDLGWILRRKK